MRLTIHHSLTSHGAIDDGDVDLDVARGTPVREIVAAFGALHVWCGGAALDQEHRAGQWPLLAGAVLSAYPRRASVAPGALHLAAIAGPDAGVVIPIDAVTAIGSAPPAAVVRDDAIDATHATAWAIPEGLRVKDHGSVNGTGTWRLRGGSLTWRGRKHLSTVRVGDVIAVGRTALEVRRGAVPGNTMTAGRDPTGSAHPAVAPGTATSAKARGGAASAPSRAWHRALLALVPGRRPRDHDATGLDALPDPTRQGGWSGAVAIGGVHAADLARAVILARGRRPPLPMPLDERWLSWLPPALAGDGLVRIGPSSHPAGESEWTILTAGEDRTTSRLGDAVTIGPVVRVRPDTADALARSQAGALPDGPPRTIHWADAAALAVRPERSDATRRIVAGLRVDDPETPWTISLIRSLPHTIVAGAAGSGKSTLLATIAGALAMGMAPDELTLAILCSGAPGPLEPYLDLPHVRAAASHAHPHAALRILDALDTGSALTVVIADDVDALGPDGRAVTERLEAIASLGGAHPVHVVMATRRPTAVLTPSLRAKTATAIALRTACESDSLDATGVADAFAIPLDARGMAIVRTGGRLDTVQAALPIADRVPRVRRCGDPLPAARTLAAAARATPDAMRRPHPAPGGPERPAS